MPPGHFGGSRDAPGLFCMLPRRLHAFWKHPKPPVQFKTLLRRLQAVLDPPEVPTSCFSHSRGTLGVFRMLPRRPRAFLEEPVVPPGRFKCSQGAPKPFRTLTSHPQAILDAHEGLPVRFGCSRGASGHFGCSQGAPGPFLMLPRCLRAFLEAYKAPSCCLRCRYTINVAEIPSKLPWHLHHCRGTFNVA